MSAGSLISHPQASFTKHFWNGAWELNGHRDEYQIFIISSLSPPLLLQRESCPPEFFSSGTMIVSATMEVYKEAMKNLLPTPAKSHYVFNLRDFARVVLGCLLVKPQSMDSKKQFVRL